jgi:hypothetical protein
MSTHKSFSRKAWRPVGVLVGTCVAVAGCSGLLDVKNPNDVTEDALNNPAAAANIVNGVLATTARMLTGITTPYASATDELDWTGSRDAWLQLERGGISDYFNEFTDQAFPWVGEARYVGDEAIKRLRTFEADGTLPNPALLAQAFLYTAVTYASIADMYDDYAFSSKTTPARPIGRAAMGTLYDKAIAYLDSANALATAGSALQFNIVAYRARAKHAKAVWTSITPKLAPDAPRSLTLINDAGATADANAAIAIASSADQAFTISNAVGTAAGINIWFEVNGRNEHRTGQVYRALIDPVTGALDIRTQALLTQFAGFGTQAGTFTLTSTRELRLILAEAALQAGNTGEFQTQINLIRALDAGRTAWDGANPAPLAMLQHERQVQLWLMRRRLADMHRFNLKESKWTLVTNYESLLNVNGLLFPIPQIERLGNPCVNDPGDC